MSSRRIQEISPATGFEAGAKVAPDAPSAELSQPLQSPPGTDHFAALEARRIEMIGEWDTRVNDMKARIADLRQQVQDKRNEAFRLGQHASCAADHYRFDALQREAEGQARERLGLINIELPKLELERTSIGGGTHPTLATLRIQAEGRIKAELDAKRSAAATKMPSFVIVESHFGWRENEQMVNFAEGQIVRDPALIRQLIERNAPLSLGV